MHKHIYRKRFLHTLLIILFCLFFPAVATLLIQGGSTAQKDNFSPVKSGKSVIITDEKKQTTLDVEEFIPCAMMEQLSINDDEELLKTFSIILRTYIYEKLGNTDSVDVSALGIPYMTYDEMETAWKDKFADNLNKLNKIMEETALLVLSYNGQLIHPYYHTLSSGNTREGTEAYLVSVSCPDDLTNKNYLNTAVYSYEAFISTVKSISGDIVLSETAPLESFQIVSKDSAGYVTEMQISGVSVDLNAFMEKFQLKSSCFEIDEYNGGIRIITKGEGHGYGLSLNTASIMAKKGHYYTEILNYFYPGTTISQ